MAFVQPAKIDGIEDISVQNQSRWRKLRVLKLLEKLDEEFVLAERAAEVQIGNDDRIGGRPAERGIGEERAGSVKDLQKISFQMCRIVRASVSSEPCDACSSFSNLGYYVTRI